ncbi:MAG: hypothetical protein C0417_10315 [Chlorobiaceae bacterium]|nr:hypothetical protein [Chlorobiaceae bacterium]
MEKSKQDIPQINYFGDVATAHIDAIYKDGKFIDFETKEPIRLVDSASGQVFMRMTVPLHSIPDDELCC